MSKPAKKKPMSKKDQLAHIDDMLAHIKAIIAERENVLVTLQTHYLNWTMR